MTVSAASMQMDVYKQFHRLAYHPDVTEVYSNFTSRSGKLSNIPGGDSVVFVGLQYFILDYIIEEWNQSFFNIPKRTAVRRHKRILEAMLGCSIDMSYLGDLHDLGYLPIRIKALPEGTRVPYLVAPLTVVSTQAGFQWLPNMIETVMSSDNWHIQTTATTATEYLRRFKIAFEATGGPMELLPFMCHDFSFRGMPGRHTAAASGFGYLTSGLAGTDTIPAVLFAEKYYGADVDKELVGASVNATEHSVTCSWIEEGEIAFIRHLMQNAAKTGILSVVSDTWDFWKLVSEYLPILKDEIMARDGKLVIRPDSGDPVKIICGLVENVDYRIHEGKPYAIEHFDGAVFTGKEVTVGFFSLPTDVARPHVEPLNEFEVKGLVECLWDIFGGYETDKGYKMLDSHIGAIYGDAITLDRQEQIFARLMEKGFVPQVVLGVGSYSFQYVTRDTHGSAVKATNVVKNGVDMEIFKDPKTDSKKKSAKGLLRVERNPRTGELQMFDQQTREQEASGLLTTVFEDGKLTRTTTLAEIREVISNEM